MRGHLRYDCDLPVVRYGDKFARTKNDERSSDQIAAVFRTGGNVVVHAAPGMDDDRARRSRCSGVSTQRQCIIGSRRQSQDDDLTLDHASGRQARVVALLAVRNEQLYLDRCIKHLLAQEIEVCVIDNASNDGTREIAETYLGHGVTRIVDHPFPGNYDWVGLLRAKERLAAEIDANWFIHQDADEILEAPEPFTTLGRAFSAVGAAGFNAVNFEEFVFLPESEKVSYEGKDYVAAMKHYYFHAPTAFRLIRAWKKTGERVRLIDQGGHAAIFDNRSIYPDNFILKHYIMLSASHGGRKYGVDRVYSKEEVEERGWHRQRVKWTKGCLQLPRMSELKRVEGDLPRYDRSDPKSRHLFTFVSRENAMRSQA